VKRRQNERVMRLAEVRKGLVKKRKAKVKRLRERRKTEGRQNVERNR
jgi:hypothetical protein